MATATLPVPALLTAEEYCALPDDGRRTELVNGVIVEMPPPNYIHGRTCTRVTQRLANYVEDKDLGTVLCNDSGVVTTRDPDSVRGPDVSYFSFSRIPKGETTEGYPSILPELVFEVLSPSNRPSRVTAKVGEYLEAGVLAVCVLDPERRVLVVHPHDGLARRYEADGELILPEVFPDFRIKVSKLID